MSNQTFSFSHSYTHTLQALARELVSLVRHALHAESLRPLLALFLNPTLGIGDGASHVLEAATSALGGMRDTHARIVTAWLAAVPADDRRRLVTALVAHVGRCRRHGLDTQLVSATNAVRALWAAERELSASVFWCDDFDHLSRAELLRVLDVLYQRRQKSPGADNVFSLADAPALWSPLAKRRLLRMEWDAWCVSCVMRVVVVCAVGNSSLSLCVSTSTVVDSSSPSSFSSLSHRHRLSTGLIWRLSLRRSHAYEDAVTLLTSRDSNGDMLATNAQLLTRRLQIEFVGEEGQDEGGTSSCMCRLPIIGHIVTISSSLTRHSQASLANSFRSFSTQS